MVECATATANATVERERAERLAAVADLADSLAGEVRACWGMGEPFLRQHIGNTNYNIVEMHLEKTQDALAQLQPGDIPEGNPK